MKINLIIATLMAMMLVSGCGQKGDLYPIQDAPPPHLENATTK